MAEAIRTGDAGLLVKRPPGNAGRDQLRAELNAAREVVAQLLLMLGEERARANTTERQIRELTAALGVAQGNLDATRRDNACLSDTNRFLRAVDLPVFVLSQITSRLGDVVTQVRWDGHTYRYWVHGAEVVQELPERSPGKPPMFGSITLTAPDGSLQRFPLTEDGLSKRQLNAIESMFGAEAEAEADELELPQRRRLRVFYVQRGTSGLPYDTKSL